MKKKHAEEHAGNHERWLLTYSDLITLLMIFFVLMYSISNVDKQKMARVANSLSQAMLGTSSGIIVGDAPGPAMVEGQGSGQETQAMNKAMASLNKYIKDSKLEGKVSVHEEERGLVVSIQEPLLFASGSAVIGNDYKYVLAKIGQALKDFPNALRVEGHTDNVPIHTAEFPSNWELSTARATNVVQFLITQVNIAPKRLCAVGYGEFRNIYPNDSDAHKGTNRRVDLVLLRSEFNKLEPEGSKLGAAAPDLINPPKEKTTASAAGFTESKSANP